MRRLPASSAASASRCCAPRPRRWNGSSPNACARHSPNPRPRHDPVRTRRARLAIRSHRAPRPRGPERAADRRRYRANADDEGGCVPAAAPRELAQACPTAFGNHERKKRRARHRCAYAKVTTGSAEDWPALGVAVALEAEGATVKSARVVISAATERATRLKGVERLLIGASIDEKTLARAGDAAADEAECVSDVRGSAAYKRELARVHVNRALHQALNS